MQAHSSSGNAINRFGRGVVVAVVAGAAAWVYSWQTSLHAQAGTIPLVPTPGVTPPLTIVTVNDGPDYQLDPHVSGDLVSYLDGSRPRHCDTSASRTARQGGRDPPAGRPAVASLTFD